MPDVLIRNVPQEVLDSLKKQAKRHNRSLQRELMATLQERSEDQIADIIAQADAIRERLLKSGRTFTDSVEIIREGRRR
jgi:plasmid stability protein